MIRIHGRTCKTEVFIKIPKPMPFHHVTNMKCPRPELGSIQWEIGNDPPEP